MLPEADAAAVWTHARRSLETLAADPGTTPGDLRRLGATVWSLLTGREFTVLPPGAPFPWERLDATGITPELGLLPVLLARTLAPDPAQPPPTAAALLETLNMLASLRSGVPVLPDMPSRAPGPDPAPAPVPEPRPPAPADSELWTRRPAQLAAANRRRRSGTDTWNTIVLLAVGAVGGFFGGVLYEKSYGPGIAPPAPAATVATPARASESAPPIPDVPLAPSPPVGAGTVAARVQSVKTLRPDVGDILKYARELRRVATLPVTDGVPFPSEGQFTRLTERFDWAQPDSPNFHRTPLLLILGYADDQTLSQKCADQLAQVLTQSGITSPIYACGMGGGQQTPEVEKAGLGSEGKFVEVWVAFTLF